MNETIATIERLAEMNEDELALLVDADRDTYRRLLMATGAFITNACGNLNKLYEKTTQLTLLLEDVNRDRKIPASICLSQTKKTHPQYHSKSNCRKTIVNRKH